MARHARLGPSGAYIWATCTASPRESDGKPNDGNDASRMGTACHGVVAECLMHDREPAEYLGRKFLFYVDAEGHRHEDFPENLSVSDAANWRLEHTVEITAEYVGFCEAYVQFVRELAQANGAEMLVEQRVPIDHMTGEADAGGTSDVILFY